MEEAKKIITNLAREKKVLAELVANDLQKSQKILDYLVKLQTFAPKAVNADAVSQLKKYVTECQAVFKVWKEDLIELNSLLGTMKPPAEEKVSPEKPKKKEKGKKKEEPLFVEL